MSESLQPRGLYSPWTSPRWNTRVGSRSFLQGNLSNPGIEPRSPALQADSLPAKPPGNTQNTGVGSISLLQGMFPTQESNWGLLHCRLILYQLSYPGSLASMSSVHTVHESGWGLSQGLAFWNLSFLFSRDSVSHFKLNLSGIKITSELV